MDLHRAEAFLPVAEDLHSGRAITPDTGEAAADSPWPIPRRSNGVTP